MSFNFWESPLSPLWKNRVIASAGFVPTPFLQNNTIYIDWLIFFSCLGQRLNRCLTSVQFNSVTQSCLTLCDPMNCSTPGLLVHHQLLESTQTHVHRVGDAIQSSHPLSSPSPPALTPSQHQGLFQWVSSSHEVAKVLEFQLQHQSLQWTSRTDHREENKMMISLGSNKYLI